MPEGAAQIMIRGTDKRNSAKLDRAGSVQDWLDITLNQS